MDAALLIVIYIVVTAILQGNAFLISNALDYPSPATGLMILGSFWIALPAAVFLFEKLRRNRMRVAAPERAPQSSNVINLMDVVRKSIQSRKQDGKLPMRKSHSSDASFRPTA